MNKISRTLALLALCLATLLVLSPASLAHHKDGHEGGSSQVSSGDKDNDGDADGDQGTAYTEDNDTNDGGTPNNQSDEGDNQHPSGKDKSEENGKSGNQGKSESDPDGDANGGPDKPNGSGGEDLADQDGNNGCGNDDDFEDDNNGNCGGKGKEKPAKVKGSSIDEEPCLKDASMPSGTYCGKGPETAKASQDEVCEKDSTMPVADVCSDTDAEGRLGTGDGDDDNDGVLDMDDRDDNSDGVLDEQEATVLGSRLTRDSSDRSDEVLADAAERGTSFAGGILPFTGAGIGTLMVVALAVIAVGVLLTRTRRRA